jgi:ferric-dicitrate binding protein FerR (iron transport regulator)
MRASEDFGSRPVDARAVVAWLKRQIAFENQPLGEVADEFNRYGHIAIEIDDEGLRSLPGSSGRRNGTTRRLIGALREYLWDRPASLITSNFSAFSDNNDRKSPSRTCQLVG